MAVNATSTYTISIDAVLDLVITTNFDTAQSTFAVVRVSNGNVIINGPMDTLINLIAAFEDWSKFNHGRLKQFSRI